MNKQFNISDKNQISYFKIDSLKMMMDYLNMQQLNVQSFSFVDNENMLPQSSESALALYPPNYKENFDLN